MLPITTCFVAGLQYLVHPLKLGSIQETINSDALIPVTLLTTEEVFGDLEGILKLFDSHDDVFVPDFGAILVEKTGDNGSQVVQGDARQIYHMDQIRTLDGFAELPSGPYFLHGPNLHQAWRLYDDDFGAFTSGVIPDDLGQPDDRAWKSLYNNASNTTAEYAQKLLDQGAVIVGKTKTSQFGTGAEWIDQQAPWSARGDGYHSMTGGSVGAAAASVGYEWLDRSVGVDDGRLVSENGIYSLVQSDGNMTKDIITASDFDRTRFFSRSLKELLDITDSRSKLHEPVLPKRIFIPADLSSADKTQDAAITAFVSILQDLLDVQAEHIDVGKIWDKSPPTEASGEGMQAFMRHAPFRSWCYDYYHAFDELRRQYRQKFQYEPFTEATPQFFWNQGKTVTEEEHRQDTERLEIYRRWFHENIMRISTTPNAKRDAILILPCGNSQVEHRNQPVATGIGGTGLVFSFYSGTLRISHYRENRISAGVHFSTGHPEQ
ncbi:hypothetical protein FSARC_2205 [Fusarium sarcochroum]|uniref:Amidase domain-containing protein n=1 Tax=Fusarium sarcochroum TaxID=1208366 RepID=A0A8H4U788_9HYPO|nr:hypothetical protein FSARC_2205 [Fusarium sarcochroum]